MLSRKVKLFAVGAFVIHLVGGQLFQQAPVKDATSVRPAEVHAAAVPTPTTPPKPEDYWVPWDNWLKKQASPLSGRDFYTAQQETGIKGEVLICITGAETNFGKVAQRGSTTNVGSVGSYDATDTTHHAASALDGIKMIGKTLNNPMLGKKTTIAQLSRKSEPYGPVYAESRENWERNVVTCLSRMTGKPVNNQFEFRT